MANRLKTILKYLANIFLAILAIIVITGPLSNAVHEIGHVIALTVFGVPIEELILGDESTFLEFTIGTTHVSLGIWGTGGTLPSIEALLKLAPWARVVCYLAGCIAEYLVVFSVFTLTWHRRHNGYIRWGVFLLGFNTILTSITNLSPTLVNGSDGNNIYTLFVRNGWADSYWLLGAPMWLCYLSLVIASFIYLLKKRSGPQPVTMQATT